MFHASEACSLKMSSFYLKTKLKVSFYCQYDYKLDMNCKQKYSHFLGVIVKVRALYLSLCGIR